MRAWKIATLCALFAIAVAVALFSFEARTRGAAARAVPSASTAPRPGTLRDALNAARVVELDESRAALPGARDHDWVEARPAFQFSRSASERGGLEPCATQQVDASSFQAWAPLSQGKFTAPRELALDAAGRFNLVIHLHGDEPVLRELIESKQQLVLYTFTLDPSQGYAPRFSGSGLYATIIAEVEKALSARAGRPARVGHVALSAWSAGFVGVAAALAQPESRDVEAVILVDGLHAPRGDRSAFEAQLKPFVDYAGRAARGERFMFVSHSSIDPPGFASTTECAHFLIAALGGRPQAVRRTDALGLELVEYFSRGDLHVRGYAGNDKPDHCAQLGVLRDVFAALGQRWAAQPPPVAK